MQRFQSMLSLRSGSQAVKPPHSAASSFETDPQPSSATSSFFSAEVHDIRRLSGVSAHHGHKDGMSGPSRHPSVKSIDFKIALHEWTSDRYQHNEPRLPIVVDPELKKRSPLPPLPQPLLRVDAPGSLQAARPDKSPLLPPIQGIVPPMESTYAQDLPSPCCAWPTPRTSMASSVGSRHQEQQPRWDQALLHAMPILDKQQYARQSSGSILSNGTAGEDIADLYHWLPTSWTSSQDAGHQSGIDPLEDHRGDDAAGVTIPSLPDFISPLTPRPEHNVAEPLATPPSLAARRRRGSPSHLIIPASQRATLLEVDDSPLSSGYGSRSEASPMASEEAEEAQVTIASKTFVTSTSARQLHQVLQLDVPVPIERHATGRRPQGLKVITEGAPMEVSPLRPRNQSIASFGSGASSMKAETPSERLMTPLSSHAAQSGSIAIRKSWRSPQAASSVEDLVVDSSPPSALRDTSSSAQVAIPFKAVSDNPTLIERRVMVPSTPPRGPRMAFSSPSGVSPAQAGVKASTLAVTPLRTSSLGASAQLAGASPSQGIDYRKGLCEAYDPTPSFDLPPLEYRLTRPAGPAPTEQAVEALLKATETGLEAFPPSHQVDMKAIEEEKANLARRLEALERQHAAGSRRRRRALICLADLIQGSDISHSQKILRCLAKLGEDLDLVARDAAVTAKKIARLADLQARHAAGLLRMQRPSARAAQGDRRGRVFDVDEQHMATSDADKDLTLLSPRSAALPHQVFQPPPVVTLSRLQSLRSGQRGQRASYRDSQYSQCSISDLARYSFPMPPSSCGHSSEESTSTIRHPRHRSNSVDVLIFPPDSEYALLAPPTPRMGTMLPSSPMSPDYRSSSKRHVRFASAATPEDMDRQEASAHTSTPPTSFILRTGPRPKSLLPLTSKSTPVSPRRDRTSNFDDPQSILLALATVKSWGVSEARP